MAKEVPTVESQFYLSLNYALRHNPWTFALNVDEEGFVPIHAVAAAFRSRISILRCESVERVVLKIENVDSDRFEIREGQIRARYGHSFPVSYFAHTVPPHTLFHGTTHATAKAIFASGIQPMERFYVHLTSELSYATRVGHAKGDLQILRVDALSAYSEGVRFIPANSHVWLAESIPARFVTTEDDVGQNSLL